MKTKILISSLVVWMTCTLTAQAATFHEGDEVKLARNEDLHFLEKVFRPAKAGEGFTVLAHRPDQKKVFVRGTDKAGHLVALSLPDDSVTLIPFDPLKAQSESLRLATAGRYDDALHMLDRARSSATDTSLAAIRRAVLQLQSASVAATKANDVQRSAVAEATRMRKNAALVDRPNRLVPSDTSNRDRAEKLRRDADALEKQAADTTSETRKELAAAKQNLADLVAGTRRLAAERVGDSVPSERPAKVGDVTSTGQEHSVPLLGSTVTIDDALRQAQKDPSTPEEFVKLLAKDPVSFPLTTFAVSLGAKSWGAAERIAFSSSQVLIQRMRALDHGVGSSPQLYIIAAQEPHDSATDAAASLLSSRIPNLSDRAYAYRVLAEYSLKNGRVPMMADLLFENEFQRLPDSDKQRLAIKSTEGLSEGAATLKVQQAIVRRLTVSALARAGKNKEALHVGDINALHERVTANCELIKGLVIAEDPFAEEFVAKFLQGLQKSGNGFYRIEVLSAQASALAELNKSPDALRVLEKALDLTKEKDSAMPSNMLNSAQIGLFRLRAEIYRKMGDQASATNAVQEGLKAAEALQNLSAAIELLTLDRARVNETIERVRSQWVGEVEQKVDGIERFIALAADQRRASDLAGAQVTLRTAAKLLSQSERPEIEAVFLCEEQARCADFAGAGLTLDHIKRPEYRQRASKLLMIEQAKHGNLREAVAAGQVVGVTTEMLDEIGGALSGTFERIVLFPYLKESSGRREQ